VVIRIATLAIAAGWLGCASDATVIQRGPVAEVSPPEDHRARPFEATDPTDADGDGIADQLEDYLIAQFAPEVRLAPDRVEWTRPASVDWYLPQVRLRFSHRLCRNHDVLAAGAVTASSIWQQQHRTDSVFCSHTDQLASSDASSTYDGNRSFYLEPVARAAHAGIPVARRDQWRLYAHVAPSSYVRPDDHLAAAYDIQIWFFYAYNVGAMGFNHQADWEHITISVSSDLAFVSAYYAEHRGGRRIDQASQLGWVAQTHPVVYSARGTHASYPRAGAYQTPALVDRCYDDGPRWETWTNFVNLGERDHILGGQDWARYDGRWGRPGWFEITSGPVGPMYNHRWTSAGSEYRVLAIAGRGGAQARH
jgi:hypothetical protein